ncbi:MAG: class 1 fructose-bisphosphatase [Chloroflexi bacterium]|nr:class 1 fructose-bisphosphatase [Chloroflexota bacterium]
MPQRLMTIERHILEQQRAIPEATGVFTNLMYDLALAGKIIARQMARAGLNDILGRAGNTNVQGEDQQKLDVFADETLYDMVKDGGRVALVASEEHEHPMPLPNDKPCGKYVLLYDPLDGSSNIDSNASVGTIFSIYRKISDGPCGETKDLLQAGAEQVAAGYIIYGSSTMMVYGAGFGVHGFTLDPNIGEFLLSHPNMTFPKKPKYYSINQGNEIYWSEGVRRYVHWLQGKAADNPRKPLSQRYIGSMVADFHRTLLEGGIFMYPADSKDPSKPFGKLRLGYEAAPLAFLAEEAGGYASDGVGSILDIKPTSIHQRTPLFIGDRDLVQQAEAFIQLHDQEWVDTYQDEVSNELVPGK